VSELGFDHVVLLLAVIKLRDAWVIISYITITKFVEQLVIIIRKATMKSALVSNYENSLETSYLVIFILSQHAKQQKWPLLTAKHFQIQLTKKVLEI
jgi:Ni,Fe-hydrogenase III component G